MWKDILKSKRGQKLKGSIFRKLIVDYIESTDSLDRYSVDDIIENIFDAYYVAHGGLTNKNLIRHKMDIFIGRYLPEGYERVPKTKRVVKKNEDLEKIRTRSGDRLKLKDWEAFKTDLRAGLNTIVPRDIYGRKSSVRIVDGDFVDNKATLNVSFRSLQTDRRYIFINFIEEDGDY